jgi:hypothetical protein
MSKVDLLDHEVLFPEEFVIENNENIEIDKDNSNGKFN